MLTNLFILKDKSLLSSTCKYITVNITASCRIQKLRKAIFQLTWVLRRLVFNDGSRNLPFSVPKRLLLCSLLNYLWSSQVSEKSNFSSNRLTNMESLEIFPPVFSQRPQAHFSLELSFADPLLSNQDFQLKEELSRLLVVPLNLSKYSAA